MDTHYGRHVAPDADHDPAATHTGSASVVRASTPDFVDLIATSLQVACEADRERLFALIARVVDLHLAGTAHRHAPQRWLGEALDDVLSAISPELLRQAAASGATVVPH